MFKRISERKLQYLVSKLCRRWASKSFRKTVNLPSTTFPLSMKGNVVLTREKDIQKVCFVEVIKIFLSDMSEGSVVSFVSNGASSNEK